MSTIQFTTELRKAIVAAVSEYLLRYHRPVNVEDMAQQLVKAHRAMQGWKARFDKNPDRGFYDWNRATLHYLSRSKHLLVAAEIDTFLHRLEMELWRQEELGNSRAIDDVVDHLVWRVRQLVTALEELFDRSGLDWDFRSYGGAARDRQLLELRKRLNEVLAEA